MNRPSHLTKNLTENLYYEKIKTVVGVLNVVTDEKCLKAVVFDSNWSQFKEKAKTKANLIRSETKLHKKILKQIQEYFAGTRRDFDIPLDPVGTAFQKSVWGVLLKIPYGQTKSYSYQAEQIGNKKAVRAVGLANGKNPIAIIVPCHRVIGKNGSLTGYAGGLSIKEKLIKIEKNIL